MARKKKKCSAKKVQSKYNVPEIIMEYVAELLPEPDSPELLEQSAEENLALFDNTIFLCTSVWNYAALPTDCGEILLEQMKKSVMEAGGNNDVIDMILEIAADMQENFPDADVIIVNHTLEPIGDEVDFGLEIIPLEEGIQAFREMK